MGLFGGRHREDLDNLLSAMHASSLRDIEDIRGRRDAFSAGIAERIDRAAALVVKLRAKGKADEAETVLAKYEALVVTDNTQVFFRGTPGQSFAEASAAAARELEALGPATEIEDETRRWRDMVAEVRLRAKGTS